MTEHKIICGNNIEELKKFPDNTFDSICTDAPYGLGEEPDPVEVMKDWVEKGFHQVKNKGGFMNKEWDAFVPQPLFWKEAFRVLKPGGYVLCFFGTRTYDWGVMAMRFAGFEIRDLVEYIYGTGFPKSLDISKQLDKEAGVKRKKVRLEAAEVGNFKNRGDSRPFIDEAIKNGYHEIDGDDPITEEAKQWEGYGTALKPAHEPIVLARKPISEKTVAKNVLKHGTGGINIDGCRIGTDVIETNGGEKCKGEVVYGKYDKNFEGNVHTGRFPSNLILDEFAAGQLDKQSGNLKSGTVKPEGFKGQYTANVYGKFANNQINPTTVYGDEGGASRFFYVAKPTQYEKDKGLRFFEYQDPASVTDFRPALKSNPENWANGTETPYTRTTPRKNTHATVKPVNLCRYLVRMITPKGGLCLDPFNGSGTTGVACKMENINYVGIEQNEYDCEISRARIKAWSPECVQQSLF